MSYFGVSLLEEFKPATLLGYVKELPEPSAYLGPTFLPIKEVNDVNFEYILGSYHRPIMASIMAWDSEAPIAGKKGFVKVAGELPPIKRKIHVEEKELIKFFRAPAGMENAARQQAIDDIYDYVDDMVKAVQARIEWLRWQALAVGTITYASDDSGVQFSLAFGVPATQQETLAGANRWSDTANSNPITDFQRWISTYNTNNGFDPGRCVISKQTLMYMLQNQAIRQLITNYTTQYISRAQLEQMFAVEGLPELFVYDEQVLTEAANGTVTASRLLPQDVLVLLPPAGRYIGEMLVGPTAEALASGLAQNTSYGGGIVSQVYETNEPPSVWVKASATSFPTMAGMQLVGIYNVW